MPKFIVDNYKNLVLEHGYVVHAEKAMMCPCYSQEKADAEADCPLCHGLHFIWRPIGAIQVAVTSIKEMRSQLVDFTQVSQGDKMVSTLPGQKLAINDRLRFTHTVEVYTETLQAKADGTFVPYYEPVEFEQVLDENGNEIPLE